MNTYYQPPEVLGHIHGWELVCRDGWIIEFQREAGAHIQWVRVTHERALEISQESVKRMVRQQSLGNEFYRARR